MSSISFEVSPAEVDAAATQAGEAAAEARGQDGAACLTTLASALPGSGSAERVATVTADWKTYIDYWVLQAEDYGAALHEASTTYAASDADASTYLETNLPAIENVPEPS